MTTQLFPPPLSPSFSRSQTTMLSSLWCVLSHWRTHCFYRNSHTVKIRFGLYRHERHPTAAMVLFHTDLQRIISIFKCAQTHLAPVLRGHEARSGGGKKEHTLWTLRELCRCLQSILYPQRSLYSCINAFQDAAHLVQCSLDGLFSLLREQGCVHFDLGVSRVRQKLLNRISPLFLKDGSALLLWGVSEATLK